MLTLIYTYYNQTKMLRRQIENWESYPTSLKKRLRWVLVDDCSELPAVHLVGEPSFDLEIYRVLTDLYCNIGGARNLGAKVCRTNWMFHSDMDHILPPEGAAKLVVLAEKKEPKFYQFPRLDPRSGETKVHPGTMLLMTRAFWEIGGFDEDFVGNYGGTDGHFRYRARSLLETEICEDVHMVHDKTGDTRGIDRSNREANTLLLEQKKQSGEWSTDCLRFPWERQR